MRLYLNYILIIMLCILTAACSSARHSPANQTKIIILTSPKPSGLETLAAREIRRYIYLRTGELPAITTKDKSNVLRIVLAARNQALCRNLHDTSLTTTLKQLDTQSYYLKTSADNKSLYVMGGSDIATLYGAYRFAEHLGVRFYLHGDTIPDNQIAFALPNLDELGKPDFSLRGIQPFHDFPEGPDWWNTQDYLAIITQLPKLRMNFIGFHCYPAWSPLAGEPAVWTGLPEDIDPNGRVKFAYGSSWANTAKPGVWGYLNTKTSDYHFGAALLFDRDNFGSDAMRDMEPAPGDPAQSQELFYRTGQLWRESFTLAHTLGVKTCIGTETPLLIPSALDAHLRAKGMDPADPNVIGRLYQGMFQRIMQTHLLDYYWLWTPEFWTWEKISDEQVEKTKRDILIAQDALDRIKAPFQLATCGWVLGPPRDRAEFDRTLRKEVPFSCIGRMVGRDFVEESFANIKGRPLWSISWFEDDPGMIAPQLWAGRMRQDAVDAQRYGCTGLMGLHWRTRILSGNVAALAQAAWQTASLKNQIAVPTELPELVASGFADGMGTAPADCNLDTVHQSVRTGMKAYHLKVPNGRYEVTLQFAELFHNQKDQRKFGVSIQGRVLADNIDILSHVAKYQPYDLTVKDVIVSDGRVHIEFVAGIPLLAGIVITGTTEAQNQFAAQPFTRKINCGGPAIGDYEKDVDMTVRPRHLPTLDFYRDWANAEFGPNAAEKIATIFANLDGKLPEPATWIDGPGGIVSTPTAWSDLKKKYSFVDDLAACAELVTGAGNQERFNYWLNTFRYMQSTAQVGCTLGDMDQAVAKMNAAIDAPARKQIAQNQILPLRRQLVQQWGQMQTFLLATVTNTSELGTICNIEQHNMAKLNLINKYDPNIVAALGEPLSADCQPWQDYRGPDRMTVYPARTSLQPGEDLSLTILVLTAQPVTEVKLFRRALAGQGFQAVPAQHVARNVYRILLPARDLPTDMEYYVRAQLADKNALTWPATAPKINQTVIFWNSKGND